MKMHVIFTEMIHDAKLKQQVDGFAGIASDFYTDSIEATDVSVFKEKLHNEVGRKLFSTHIKFVASSSWDDVLLADRYFESFKLVSSDVFLDISEKQNRLKSSDLARVIQYVAQSKGVSIFGKTQLQKLTYFVYADFLQRKDGLRPVVDAPIKQEHGPFFQDVINLSTYSGRGETGVSHAGEGDAEFLDSQMKVSSSVFGDDVFESVRKIVDQYGRKNGGQLENMTHRPGTPWSRTKNMSEITDDLILKYHSVEVI